MIRKETVTYHGEDGGEEVEVVGEYWRKVVALGPARWHFGGREGGCGIEHNERETVEAGRGRRRRDVEKGLRGG